MRALTVAALAGVAAVAVAAQPARGEQRNFQPFDSIHVQDAIRVDVTSGDQLLVDVSGPEADRVRTELDGATLNISEIGRPWFGHDRQLNATVRITMPRVVSLESAKGATLMAVDVHGGDVIIGASMGGELRISGNCQSATVNVSMGGVVRANDFQCARATISASMGGDARVFASSTYDASASMGGEVRVAGGGTHGRISTSMGGEISQE
jgi:hypothetical protein